MVKQNNWTNDEWSQKQSITSYNSYLLVGARNSITLLDILRDKRIHYEYILKPEVNQEPLRSLSPINIFNAIEVACRITAGNGYISTTLQGHWLHPNINFSL